MPVTPSIGLLGNVGAGPAEIMELARAAEGAGWAGAWMIEYEYDSFAFDQAIAMATSRIVTGSCISRFFTRHPLLVAETATVIDLLAPGRFAIGLGSGGVSEPPPGDRAAGGARALKEVDPRVSLQRWGTTWERPVAQMREYIEVIRLAVSGEAVDYSGDYYRFEGVKLSLTPSGHIPIYLGARLERMLHLGGRVADGIFLWLVGEGKTREAVEVVQTAALEAGRDPKAVRMGCLIPTCVSDDGGVARRAMRGYLVDFYLGRAAYSQVLAESGFPEAGEQVRLNVTRGDNQAAAACIPDDALDQLAISGTPADSRSLLSAWAERGIDLPVLYVFPADEDWPGAYRKAIVDLAPGG